MHLLLSAVCLGAAVAVALAAVPPSDQILQYLKSRGEISESALPSPLKVVYIDWRDVNWNAPDQNVKDIVNGGYNVVILAFYLTSGPTDMLQAYAGLPNSTKESVQAFVHSAGAVLLLSAGGSSSVPFSQDPAVFGAAAARFAAENYLDGVRLNFTPAIPFLCAVLYSTSII